MDLQANDLILFAQVMEAGSFAQAAERAGIPKSTVSRRIAAIERHLGERLLLRSTRQLKITDFGVIMLAHAKRLQAELEEAAALASSRHDPPRGRLRVSAPPQFAETVLGPWLIRFAVAHPEIQLEIDVSARSVDMLAEKFDLALRIAHQLPDDARLVARRICEFQGCLYASPAYIARRGTPATPQDLMQHACLRFLSSKGEPMPWRLQRGTEMWEGLPPAALSSNSAGMHGIAVHQGLGIATLDLNVGEELVAQGQLLRVLPQWSLPPVILWGVMPERRLIPARTRALLDLVIAALQAPARAGTSGSVPSRLGA